MSPDEKETVIESLHHVGLTCLMCGDGANDVGALKQADVGVALLSGFGNANVDKGADRKSTKDDSVALTAFATKEDIDALRCLPVKAIKAKIRSIGVDPDEYPEIMEKEDLVKLYRIKASELAVKRHDMKMRMDKAKMTKAEMKANQQKLVVDKQAKMMERVRELEAKGESFAQFKAMKEFMSLEWGESNKKKKEMQKMNTVEGGAAMLAAQLDDLETGDLPMVKLGDASIAAPFTSKMPSIRSCVDIIRQGRCTLVTTIQMVSEIIEYFCVSSAMSTYHPPLSHTAFFSSSLYQYQILALNCLISAYSLSVLYLDGVKYGDTQMTAMGILGSISYMSVSRSKPLDRLSSVRPLASIFHPSLFISLLGQFAAHLATMYWATRMAKQHMAPGYETDLDGQFQPGILNSVVFLVSSVQQVTVFVVNLQGRPFMTGLTENRPLLWSLLATFIMTFMFASESVPGLNKYFQLVPFPDDNFRDTILRLLAADVMIAFFFDRLMKFIFCREILFASMKGWTMKDIVSLSKTVAILFAVMYMLLGNEETWEELLREEGMFDDANEMNATISETLIETARNASEKQTEF
jgi:cation-transporting ATPase 13A1